MKSLKIIYSRLMRVGEVQRQSLISLIWQITFTGIGFLSTMYFAQTVGAEILGTYFLFLSYFGVISLFSDGGLGGAAVKKISEGEEQNKYFTASFSIRVILVIIITGILLLSRDYFVDFNSTGIFNWIIVALFVSSAYNLIQNGIAGSNKMGVFATINFIKNISCVLIQIAAVYAGYEARGLVGGFVAGMLIASIIGLSFLNLRFARFELKNIVNLCSFSFWLFLTSSGVIIYANIDTIMIGYFLKNSDVGIYRVAFQFTTFAIIVTTELRGVLWPKVSRWGKNKDYSLIEKSLSKALTYSLMVSVPIIAGGILLGDKLLYFLYGAEFASGYLAFDILLMVQISNIFQYLLTSYLGALDHQKDAFKVTAITAIGNVILNAALIPIFGIVGASIATFVTMTLNALMARNRISKIINIIIEYDSLKNILLSTVIMSFFVVTYRLIIPLSSIWLTLLPIVIGGLAYSLAILKIDRNINNMLKTVVIQMNLQWPSWLQ
ncbi:MAG: hypothetical protein PWQ75_1035 [Methanolobus sp.]|jgi:O-antigen/teichoic acid export membrane protein|uniref:flippase n=1 Tax=Methanolobus sp. TaxID=1874737 RepID=UPI002583F542|nr:flippase [Methanolobus sp.]MDK2831283.1 hypothetical protein [Methanolobus sp.]